MPTLFSHPAAALATRLGAGGQAVPGRLVAVAAGCSILPDIDVVGFWLGVPYGHLLGHRGLTHSLFFAVALGSIAIFFADRLHASRCAVFLAVTLATASHGLLDALTSGGLGVALFSPFSNARYFFPWRPIGVAPLSVVGFLEPGSRAVLRSEVLWVWLPLLGLGLLGAAIRHSWRSRRQRPPER